MSLSRWAEPGTSRDVPINVLDSSESQSDDEMMSANERVPVAVTVRSEDSTPATPPILQRTATNTPAPTTHTQVFIEDPSLDPDEAERQRHIQAVLYMLEQFEEV